MYIKSLKLNNYCQYSDTEVEFDGNLIIILGSNGHGKSNLMGAIQFGLTGEQSGKNKSDLLSWGTKQGSVQLIFEHRGIDYTVSRSLRGTKAKIEFGDSCIEGIKEVNEFIAEHVGLDKDIAKQSCFVRQKEVDSILFGGTTSKEVGLQKLIGLADISKLHSTLGTVINSLPPEQDYKILLDDNNSVIQSVSNEIKEFKIECLKLDTSLKELPDKSVIEEQIDDLKQSLRDQEKKREKEERLLELKSKLDVEKTKLSELPAISDEQDTSLQIEKLSNLIKDIERVKDAQTKLDNKLEELKRLDDGPSQSELDDLKQAYEKVEQTYSDYKASFNFYAEFIDEAKELETTTCPWCGSTLESGDQIRKYVVDKYESLKKGVEKYTKDVKNLRSTIEQKSSERNKIRRLKEKLESEISGLKTVTESSEFPVSRENSLRTALKQLKDNQERYEAAKLKIENCNSIILRLSTQIEVLEKELQDFNKDYDTEAEQKLEKFIKVRDLIDSMLKQKSLADYKLSDAKSRLVKAQKFNEEIREKAKSAESRQEALKVARGVREFFHYDNGPKTLVGGILQQLNVDINKYLDVFDSEFSVIIEDGSTDFKTTFKDGRQMPSTGYPLADTSLSGGQKVQLSIAFRFACYQMFAANIGFMSLDEPTAYLDKHKITAFPDVLEIVKNVAQAMHMQLLLATHEEALVGAGDLVINVDEL